MKTPAYAEHYAKTGSGLNACMASGQLAWMKRHQPERIARATTTFHCKDWLYFKLTGERATDPAEANFTFGNYRTRRYEPSILAAMGIADCERLLPPIVDGASVSHPLESGGGRRDWAAGGPTGRALLSRRRLHGAGRRTLRAPQRRRRFRLRLDRHAHALRCDAGRGSPQRIALRLCHAVPDPHAAATMQSNMAATLNIDWLLDIAREAASWAGAEIHRAALLKGMDARVLDAAPGSAIYHPYIFEAGERGPFLDPNARAQFSGLSTRTSLAGMMRAVYRGPRLRRARLLRRERRAPARSAAGRRSGPFDGAADRFSPPRSAPRCARSSARKPAPPARR